jgi:ParB family transcriptional regulator, chromosome partitioning protein
MSRLDRFNEIGTSLSTTSTAANRDTITALQAEIERLQQAQPTAHLPPDAIKRSPYQPRKYFDPDSQSQLNANVREFGILQNLVVRATDDGYELIAGERRSIAAVANNLATVPVVILSLSDRDARRLALAENIHRDNLNPIEETQAIMSLLAIELEVETLDEVKSILYALNNLAKGKKVNHNVMVNIEDCQIIVDRVIADNAKGMNWRSFVNNRLPLLNLPDLLLDAILKGEIEYTKAQAIAKIDDLDRRAEMLEMAIDQHWSLAQIKAQIKTSQINPPATNLEPKQRSSEGNRVPRPEEEPKQRIQSTLKNATSSKVWQDPQKWKKIDKLLAQIDDLLAK